jgi:hypothetical protein
MLKIIIIIINNKIIMAETEYEDKVTFDTAALLGFGNLSSA